MGMFDNIVMLDEPLTCPIGHPLAGLQTKSFPEPSMNTYLVRRDRVLRASHGPRRDDGDEEESSAWRVIDNGAAAVHETVYSLEPVTPLAAVSTYTHCAHCDPVLVRTDRASLWGDIVNEHGLFVEFTLHFSEATPMRVERITGGREELFEDLRRAGLRVLDDDAPLAVAHREIQHARRDSTGGLRPSSMLRRP